MHADSGLLTELVDPEEHRHVFAYDDSGRLIRDEDPAGGFSKLKRVVIPGGYQVTLETADGHQTEYTVETLPTGASHRTTTPGDCAGHESTVEPDGDNTVTYADGTVVTETYGPDARWKMLVPAK